MKAQATKKDALTKTICCVRCSGSGCKFRGECWKCGGSGLQDTRYGNLSRAIDSLSTEQNEIIDSLGERIAEIANWETKRIKKDGSAVDSRRQIRRLNERCASLEKSFARLPRLEQAINQLDALRSKYESGEIGETKITMKAVHEISNGVYSQKEETR